MSEFDPDQPLPEHMLAELAVGLRPVELSKAQRDRMRSDLLSRVQGGANATSSTLATSEWTKLGPGLEVQELWRDEQSGTHLSLIRMQPGGLIPAHGHKQPEELVVLRGECRIGARVFHEGDVFEAPVASIHEDVTTDSGVTFLLRGEYPYPSPA